VRVWDREKLDREAERGGSGSAEAAFIPVTVTRSNRDRAIRADEAGVRHLVMGSSVRAGEE